MIQLFNPRLITWPSAVMLGHVSTDMISDEPLLYSASPEFAREFGGPLTQAALRKMEECLFQASMLPDGHHWVIDTRSHMLMPGQYPAIGGWHCDAVPRANYNAQPDLKLLRSDIWHAAVHVSTHPEGVSSTEFLSTPVSIHINPERVWSSAHESLQQLLKLDDPTGDAVKTPGDGQVVVFNMPTFHRARPAVRRGWRWWMRASMYYARPINKIRRHVQVYTSSEGTGW